jgi:ankyrin repeat protein
MAIATKHPWIFGAMLLFSASTIAAQSGDLRLVDAVRQKDRRAVTALLAGRIDVNARLADGATALHWAAHWDDLETADHLIRAGADVNARNDHGITPLWLACTNANASIVEKLLSAGADPNAALPTGETVLMTCARTGNAEAVANLLARGAAVDARETLYGQTALMWAVGQGQSAVAQILIEKGADVRARSKSGFTPLMFAARGGDVESAGVLLAAGADVNETAPVTETGREIPAVQRLGNYSAPEAVPPRNMTPLLMAAASGHEKLAIFFLEKGADANAWDGGAAAIHYAMLEGMTNLSGVPPANYVSFVFRPNMRELVKALLARGANPNVRLVSSGISAGAGRFRGAAGATPFLLATATNDTDLMRRLVAQGADPLLRTNSGVTPLMLAAGVSRGNSREKDAEDGFRAALETLKLTLELGNDIRAVDNRGWTALHGAAYTGADPIVQLLVDNGADVNAKAKREETPLSLAIASPGDVVHASTGDLLLKLGATPLTTADISR